MNNVCKRWEDLVGIDFKFNATATKPMKPLGRVLTLGSCFANEIRSALMDAGVVTLPRLTNEFRQHIDIDRCFDIPSWGCYDERIHLQFYNAGSIAQELLRAVGRFEEERDDVWSAGSSAGRIFQDPFKRYLFSTSHEKLIQARDALNRLVVEGLREANSIILTLGLTESFLTPKGKFACMPPTIIDRKALKESKVSFMSMLTTYETLKSSLQAFLEVFKDKQIILTTSPIPLDRTFRNLDIAVANAESKSILRSVCSQLVRDFENINYFPSFEMVLLDRGSWREDFRHIKRDKVKEKFMSFSPDIASKINEQQGSEIYRNYNNHWRDVCSHFMESYSNKDRYACRSLFDDVYHASQLNGQPTIVDLKSRDALVWTKGECHTLNAPAEDYFSSSIKVFTNLKSEFIAQETENADVVIELGSGAGLNLLRLGVHANDKQRYETSFHAFEFTECGRSTTQQLAEKLGVSVRTHPFDFNNLAQFKEQLQSIGQRVSSKVVLFTCYSIEQIPFISADFFDVLLSIRGLSKVFHIEPVGWQLSKLDTIFQRGFAAESRRLNYNLNLCSVLRSLVDENKIQILDLKVNYLSHRYDLPGTIITWAPRNALI